MESKDIIKALECCIKSSHLGECFENKCPLISEKGCKVGKETLYPYALELIKNQQAEIVEMRRDLLNEIYVLEHQLEIAKTEAYKEFWELLKVRAKERVDYYTPQGCDLYFSNGTLCGYTAMLEAGEKLLTELKTGTSVIVKQGGAE